MSEKTLEAVEEVVEKEVAETVEEVAEKPYTLRDLKNGDLWLVIRILGKVLPDDMKGVFVQLLAKEKTLEEIGMMVGADILTEIIKNLYKAETEVNKLCSDLAGVTVEELNEMPFGTTALIVMDVFSDVKNTPFFKVLSKLFS